MIFLEDYLKISKSEKRSLEDDILFCIDEQKRNFRDKKLKVILKMLIKLLL